MIVFVAKRLKHFDECFLLINFVKHSYALSKDQLVNVSCKHG
jgi:hypothetical protein